MELQEKLKKLSPYRAGFNVYENQFVVNITYNKEWTVIAPNCDDVLMTNNREKKNLYYYIASMDVDLSRIFDYIDETIKYNKDLEEKAILFKDKVNELKDIFTEEKIETLRTLEFTFKKPKAKSTSKKSSTKKSKSEKKTLVKDETVENDESKDSQDEDFEIGSYEDVVIGGKGKDNMYEFTTIQSKTTKKLEKEDVG